ncbi:Uncharacterised protein [uncultured archaeon]|nr:Uncharacterised protein [uncultured archaeon]
MDFDEFKRRQIVEESGHSFQVSPDNPRREAASGSYRSAGLSKIYGVY